MEKHCFHLKIFVFVSAKKARKSEEDEQTLEELNSAYCHSQGNCQLVQTSKIKRIKLSLFLPYDKHLINRAKSVNTREES